MPIKNLIDIFYWIDRIITGDTLFGLAIWLVCVLSAAVTYPAKWPLWIKWLYFLALSFFLMVLAHYYIDILQEIWVTPIDEPMIIVR